MGEIKTYTSIKQSKKLAKILPIESADAHYWCKDGDDLRLGGGLAIDKEFDIPAWSLAALLNVLPKVEGFKPIIDLDINLIRYEGSLRDTLVTSNDNLVDAAVDMIIILHEQNLL